MTRSIALVLTLLTGFSGLAYQITWQRYLGTLLGSHSEATAAVLGIFLGGLSVGYWLFGRLTLRLVTRAAQAGRAPRLLLAYGLLEAAIGVYALAFPLLFRGVFALSHALPLASGGVGFAVDVALAALLIGPATVLMGGTIPILTQALSKTLEEATRFHALIYAFNTVGAFAGALASGFYLVPVLGLVRVMLAMGIVNLVAGAIFAALGLRAAGAAPAPVAPSDSRSVEGLGVYAVVALLGGFAMMVLQTGVIRVAALSFGPSQFTFSMVVAIFVLCIALGSFAVSALPDVKPRLVVANQWALAAFVLLLYFALPRLPYWAYVMRTLFQESEPAFYLFQFQIFLLLGVLCGPAILCSGASLPLLFHQLRREVGDLGSVAGSLYSWNTVGSLLGALLGGYALLFWLDLDEVYILALGALLLAALLLTVRALNLRWPVAIALAPVVALPSLIGGWDPRPLSLGLFREREILDSTYRGARAFLEEYPPADSPLIFHQDDPTITVTVWLTENPDDKSLTLRTNGKIDGNTHGDMTTMVMLGIVPALFVDHPKRAFVIGFGTGVTAGELADLDSIEQVVVSEISTGVMRAAPLFDFANRGASRNGKIEIVRSDAYRAFMRSEGSFDLIVSEPSHPWVSGVENLYSREFLAAARARLSPGGVFAQWFHLYEMDEPTVELVLRTFTDVFDDVSAWYMQGPDLLLLGFDDATGAKDQFRLEQRAALPDFRAALHRAGVESFPALLAHELFPLGVLHAAGRPGPTQSLYHPRLGYLAGRAYFLRGDGGLPFTGDARTAAVGSRNSLLRLYANRFDGKLPEQARDQIVRETCKHGGKLCATLLAEWQVVDPASPSLARIRDVAGPRTNAAADALKVFFDEQPAESAALTPQLAKELGSKYVDHFHHAAPFRSEALLDVWGRCRILPPSPAECADAFAKRQSARPFDDSSSDEWIDRCSAAPRLGQECVRGLDGARALLEGPTTRTSPVAQVPSAPRSAP